MIQFIWVSTIVGTQTISKRFGADTPNKVSC